MLFIKINNLTNQFGQCDYKGLDISQFVPGSQVYTKSFSNCAVATTQEDIPAHTDLTEMTEDEYTTYRQVRLDEISQEQQSLEQQLAQAQVDNQILGSQLFALQTSLLDKGVID
jgi:hypothetical protein